MRRLREILRNEYIGAIAIGFIFAQAAGSFISAVVQPLVTYYENRNRPSSVFAAHSIFNWPQIILFLTSMLLHLIVGILLIIWLYRKGTGEPLAAAQTAGPRENPPAKS